MNEILLLTSLAKSINDELGKVSNENKTYLWDGKEIIAPGFSTQTALKLISERDRWKGILEERQLQLESSVFVNEEELMNHYQAVLDKLLNLIEQFGLSATFKEISYEELNQEYRSWQEELKSLQKASADPEKQAELSRRIQLMPILKDEILSLNKEKEVYRSYFSEKLILEKKNDPKNSRLQQQITRSEETVKMTSMLKEKQQELTLHRLVTT